MKTPSKREKLHPRCVSNGGRSERGPDTAEKAKLEDEINLKDWRPRPGKLSGEQQRMASA